MCRRTLYLLCTVLYEQPKLMTNVFKECLETSLGYFLSTTTLMGLLMQVPHYHGHIEEPVSVHQWCGPVPWCLQLKELRDLLERWLIRMKSPGLCDIINIKSNVDNIMSIYFITWILMNHMHTLFISCIDKFYVYFYNRTHEQRHAEKTTKSVYSISQNAIFFTMRCY